MRKTFSYIIVVLMLLNWLPVSAQKNVIPKKSVIQIAELKYMNGEIVWDRDEPVSIKLK